jgi:hypothetical protein
MTYEQHGSPVPGNVLHLGQALLLKARVANGQNLINQQDIGFQMRCSAI